MVLFGGNANNSSNAGFVYANAYNGPSDSNANIGSRQCFLNIWERQPYLMVKYFWTSQ